MSRDVALIVGVTGIVGNSLCTALQSSTAPGAPWRIHGIARRPKPSWFTHEQVDYIQCNLLDKSDTVQKLSHLSEVTHIFYVTWIKEDTEEKNCEANGNMLQNLLDTLVPVAKNLQHICLQTGTKQYLGPYTHFGTIQHNDVPFTEDLPRVSRLPNFYYTLEDILFSTCESKPSISWSVHRPNIIFGIAPRNYANVLGSLAIYASICKRTGLGFVFPGDQRAWESLT